MYRADFWIIADTHWKKWLIWKLYTGRQSPPGEMS